MENEPVGRLNRFYGKVYHPVASRISTAARTLKRRNRLLYRVLQYAIVIGLAYLIFA